MLEPSAIHLWTWDARPYPVFPGGDSMSGATGRTGKPATGSPAGSARAPLDALVAAILDDAGIGDFDTSALGEGVDGYVIDRPMSPRAAIEPLALAYAFDASRGWRPRCVFARAAASRWRSSTEDDLVLPDDARAGAADARAGNRAAARGLDRASPMPTPTTGAPP